MPRGKTAATAQISGAISAGQIGSSESELEAVNKESC
jgi:hypothetical protein